MKINANKKIANEQLLAAMLRQEDDPGRGQKLSIVWRFSVPAILAQLTSIMMQYIDTAMVGNLGAGASAAIGVVSTSTWLLNGLCSAVATGFSVQAAQKIGARQERDARHVLKHALVFALCFSGILMAAAIGISGPLPIWLGAGTDIQKNASIYFFIYACSLPAFQLQSLAGSMLQCSGNMRTPAILDAAMCGLDVVFNLLFIQFFGVPGAALGTALATIVICIAKLWAVCVSSPILNIRRKEPCPFRKAILSHMVRIGLPMGFEHIAICGAMILSTRIIAPLGTAAMAANSIAVTAESICYMPGYGIANAATTLVGQSIGAGRKTLAKSFSNLSTLLGCLIMTGAGILMYFACPLIFRMLTPDMQVQQLATDVLRIELFAEPLFAASIVASGALRGAGDSLVPCLLNLASIWGVRLTLSVLLVGQFGLSGVWVAMCAELCVRGILLVYRQQRFRW
ncbi:MATE family efflux transporter [Lachnospiraceae bacterium JLR.KK009]|jgi:putative MATE family efflux protein|nr:MATE efflux family protein [Lachnospiraceae bacterium A2]MCI8705597.1 MATE family efflux transporter [Lachnospiraceae bacterium]